MTSWKHVEFLGWREKNNREVARTFKFKFCDALDGLSHVGGQCPSAVQVCCVVWGWAHGPYLSHLGGGYPKIPLLQFAGVGGCLWYHEERSRSAQEKWWLSEQGSEEGR